MTVLAAIAGTALLLLVWLEGFETIILPRRIKRSFRFTRIFYLSIWRLWSGIFDRIRKPGRRDLVLSYFGPASLIALLIVWVALQIVGFALLQYAAGSQVRGPANEPGSFSLELYMSASNFFTLGLGDAVPKSAVARALSVIEAGTGFGFLAIVIGYLPTLYTAFSRREVDISLLDARAGSPPSAVELLRRSAANDRSGNLEELLHVWEAWAGQTLESHLSYPVLCFYRSQHSNESWVGALTTILDTCALVLSQLNDAATGQARLTFAAARHAVVDLSQLFSTAPERGAADRLPPQSLEDVRSALKEAGWNVKDGAEAAQRLADLRRLYEPYVLALASYLRFLPLPAWLPSKRPDNWQTSAWETISARPVVKRPPTDHF